MRPLTSLRLRHPRGSHVSSILFVSTVSRVAIASFCLTLSALSLANGSHHSGGGDSSGSDGPCIRWEKIDSGATDASSDASRVTADASLDAADASDAAETDGATDAEVDASGDANADAADAGASSSPPPASSGDLHIGERCVEHAGLFGCAVGPARSSQGGAGGLALASLVAAFVALASARSRRRRG